MTKQTQHKNFFNLVKDYYGDMEDLCVAMDRANDAGCNAVDYCEQHRLMLHMILDAIDQIDDEAFWRFVNSCKQI